MSIQIQPIYAERQAYVELAVQEGLTFEALEFSMPGLPENLKKEAIAAMAESNLFTGFHGNFIDVNPASGDPDFKKLSRNKIEESCILAQKCGIKRVVFHCSCFPFLRGGYMRFWADQCADYYTELAETFDLELYIENSQDLDPSPLALLMKKISSARVKVCLDIGHAFYSSATLEQWFDELGEHIGYIHLSDNMGLFDEHLPLGCGAIDWVAVSKMTTALSIADIPMTLEVGNLNGIKTSLLYLKENHLFGME